jgi:DNA-binding transcriptional MerR regulator
MGAPLRSGAVAALAGVSTDTLRFYERRGLLPRPPRDANGYRRYPAEAVDRVRLVQRALDAGFTIEDLAKVLRRRDAGGAPCREVYEIAAMRLRELEERLTQMTAIRDGLRRALVDWKRRLDATPNGRRAALLDDLSGPLTRPSAAASRRAVRRRARASSSASRNPSD